MIQPGDRVRVRRDGERAARDELGRVLVVGWVTGRPYVVMDVPLRNGVDRVIPFEAVDLQVIARGGIAEVAR